MVDHVCIVPSGGIKSIDSTVTRIASYIVNEELLPKKSMILCFPAYMRGVEEDLVMVEDYPSILMDCQEETATKIFYITGIIPAARIYLPEIIKHHKLSPGSKRSELDEQGNELARMLAKEVSRVALSMLENPNYHYKKQQLKPKALRNDNIPEDPFNYIKLSPGIYRPDNMPSFLLKEDDF